MSSPATHLTTASCVYSSFPKVSTSSRRDSPASLVRPAKYRALHRCCRTVTSRSSNFHPDICQRRTYRRITTRPSGNLLTRPRGVTDLGSAVVGPLHAGTTSPHPHSCCSPGMSFQGEDACRPVESTGGDIYRAGKGYAHT